MEDPRAPDLHRPVERALTRRWWPGPRIGSWPDAVQMALPVAAAALFTACGVGAALLLDSSAGGRWAAPVVAVVGLVTVAFYGWAIYTTVHPLPTVRSVPPTAAAIDIADLDHPLSEELSVQQRQSPEGEPR